ncbi:MAG: hypothetical protein AAFQ09_06180 [Pseudomonadota bacterium]
MSPLLLQIFAFMLVTFLLGLGLGWLIWRFGRASDQALDTMKTEIDFWRSSLEQCRHERDTEQKAVAVLHEEKKMLKRRIASLEARPKS